MEEQITAPETSTRFQKFVDSLSLLELGRVPELLEFDLNQG